jgi:hypothetical protein
MPVGVDDLLIIVAEEAGKALAAEVAKDIASGIVDFLFSRMATKEDLQRLAQQIDFIVHQELMSNRTDDMELKVSNVVHRLGQYKKSRDVQLLGQHVNADLVDSYERIQQLASPAQVGSSVYHLEFVHIVRYVGANTAYWMIKVYELQQSEDKAVFADELRKSIELLEVAISSVHSYEDETISPLSAHNTPGEWIDSGDIPPRHVGRGPPNSSAWYSLSRGRYPGGIINKTKAVDGTGAREQFQPEYDADVSRIANESAERERLIYTPAGLALTQMKALLDSLAPK